MSEALERVRLRPALRGPPGEHEIGRWGRSAGIWPAHTADEPPNPPTEHFRHQPDLVVAFLVVLPRWVGVRGRWPPWGGPWARSGSCCWRVPSQACRVRRRQARSVWSRSPRTAAGARCGQQPASCCSYPACATRSPGAAAVDGRGGRGPDGRPAGLYPMVAGISGQVSLVAVSANLLLGPAWSK